MSILVTGAAGFIGFHVSKLLLQQGFSVVGIDNLNPYYDPELKVARLKQLQLLSKDLPSTFSFLEEDISNASAINDVFDSYKPTHVIHLAAQAGVRYSIENPAAYIQANLVGFSNILESSRQFNIAHLLYASSSSVYGGNTKLPFSESDSVDHPVSLYAATKKSNELMAHSYSHLFGLPTTGLRFFTVYGPWGRPDMALFLFTKAILEGKEIHLFNNGQMSRDFTYIDDIVKSMTRLLHKPPIPDESFDTNTPNPAKSWAPYQIFNIGNSSPSSLISYVEAIEHSLGLEAKKVLMPMQAGDVVATSADTSALNAWIDFKPSTPISDGVNEFTSWYKSFYHHN